MRCIQATASRALLAVALATSLAPQAHAQQPAGLAALASRYNEITKKLFDENEWMNTTPDAPAEATALWHLQREWSEAWLNEHPEAAAGELAKSFLQLQKDVSATALLLAPMTYLVGTNDRQVGTFFVVSQRNGKFTIVWSVEQSGSKPWIAASEPRCLKTPEPDQCRQLWPFEFDLLARGANGQVRFAVQANYLQWMGGTTGQQLSVWSWNGAAAAAQFTGDFAVYLDQPVGTRIDGNIIQIRYKDSWKTLFSCGGCEGYQRDWSLRLTPTGVTDLGRRSVVPELEAADEAFDAMIHHRNADRFAAAEAQKVIRRELGLSTKANEVASLGMLLEWSLARVGGRSQLCLAADGLGATLRIKMVSRDGRSYLNEVRRGAPGESCPKQARLSGN